MSSPNRTNDNPHVPTTSMTASPPTSLPNSTVAQNHVAVVKAQAPQSLSRGGPIRRPRRQSQESGRTHEENQERAYIAASRRGDRSLEARLESARRASEIHKRRCGRGLRITEEAVLNEEMYEEEDPDYEQRLNRIRDFRAAMAFPPSVVSYHPYTMHVSAPPPYGYSNSPPAPSAPTFHHNHHNAHQPGNHHQQYPHQQQYTNVTYHQPHPMTWQMTGAPAPDISGDPTSPSSTPMTPVAYNNSYHPTTDPMANLPTPAPTPFANTTSSHIFLPPTQFAHQSDGSVVTRKESKFDLDGPDAQARTEDAVIDTSYAFFNFDYPAETCQELEWSQFINPEFNPEFPWPT